MEKQFHDLIISKKEANFTDRMARALHYFC